MTSSRIFEDIIDQYRHIPPENFNYDQYSIIKMEIIKKHQLSDPTRYHIFLQQAIAKLEIEQSSDPLARRFIEHIKSDQEPYLAKEEMERDTDSVTSSMGSVASFVHHNQRMTIKGSTIRHILTPDGRPKNGQGHAKEFKAAGYSIEHGKTVFAKELARTLNRQEIPHENLNEEGQQKLSIERKKALAINDSKSVHYHHDPVRDVGLKAVYHADGFLTTCFPCGDIKRKYLVRPEGAAPPSQRSTSSIKPPIRTKTAAAAPVISPEIQVSRSSTILQQPSKIQGHKTVKTAAGTANNALPAEVKKP